MIFLSVDVFIDELEMELHIRLIIINIFISQK